MPDQSTGSSGTAVQGEPRLPHTPPHQVWEALAPLPRLSEVARVFRGIGYSDSTAEDSACVEVDELTSDHPRPGFEPGLFNAEQGFEPYVIRAHAYLNADPKVMLDNAYRLPWKQPKVIAHAAPLPKGPWTIAGSVDEQGLYCSACFLAAWPLGEMPLEVLAAVLTGPVASSYVSAQSDSRSNPLRAVRAIPVPRFTPAQVTRIVGLVREYRTERRQWLLDESAGEIGSRRCLEALRHIDAEVLAAYDLPPRLERSLLDVFAGFQRPGPVPFDRYYPPGFRPAVPWRKFLSDGFRESTAAATLRRLPVLHDPVISEAVAALSDNPTAEAA